MKIIAHADDFGVSEESVKATIEGFEAGSLTSATIMVNLPGTSDAIEYAKAHPEYSFGIHLIFCTDELERPLSPPETIGDLVTETGAFLDSNSVRKKAIINRISRKQIACEAEAQLAFLQDAGVEISHVDSHGHLHKFPLFQRALRPVLLKFNIRRLRSIQNVFLRKPIKKPTYWLGKLWRRSIESHFLTTKYFYMPAASGDVGWSDALMAKLDLDGILEVGVHPGLTGWRSQELADMQEFVTKAKRYGHEFVTWRDVQ